MYTTLRLHFPYIKEKGGGEPKRKRKRRTSILDTSKGVLEGELPIVLFCKIRLDQLLHQTSQNGKIDCQLVHPMNDTTSPKLRTEEMNRKRLGETRN